MRRGALATFAAAIAVVAALALGLGSARNQPAPVASTPAGSGARGAPEQTGEATPGGPRGDGRRNAGALLRPDPAFTAALAEGDRLRVGGRSPATRRLVDRGGDTVLLRGVSVNALVDYGGVRPSPVPVRSRDLDQMAALGFNVMRLAVSWSKVMPSPGQLDRAHLRKITALVRAAGRHGLHTVVSMHADRYAARLGRGTEFDGAPRWATFTDGLPCGDPRPRYYTPCAAAAARHFYRGDRVAGRSGLEWYVRATTAVSRAARAGGPGYAGLDLVNEPTDPDATPDDAPTARWTDALHRLQGRTLRALRNDGDDAPLWIQPQGPRSTAVRGAAALPSRAQLDDDTGLVYAPHAYVDVYDGGPTPATAGRMAAQYAAFADEARRLRAALVVGEFPGAAGGAWEDVRREHLRLQTRLGAGGIAWLWKLPRGSYGWGTLDARGGLRADTAAAQTLSAPRVVRGGAVARVDRQADVPGTVLIRAPGSPRASGPAASTADVWLGTGFGSDASARSAYRVTSSGGAEIQRVTEATSRFGDLPGRGLLVRVSLPAAGALRLEPAG